MTDASKSPPRRLWRSLLCFLLPNTIFARLFGLLFAAIVISQVLPSVLIFAFNSSAPPSFYPDDRPPPRRDDLFDERGPNPNGPPLGFGGPRPRNEGMHMPPEFIASQVLQFLALTLAAWIGARFIARPIEDLAQAASRLGDNLSSPPIDETGPDEAVRAARVFNRMQQRIRAQLDERARFLAAVSHDLRTPLTRMRLRVAQLDDATERNSALSPVSVGKNATEKLVTEKIGDDIDEMTLMIDATLNYLRGEAQPETWQLLDIHALLESMTEDAQEIGRDVMLTGSATPLSVQPLSLRRCIDNLLDNALLYGGKAEITLRDTPHGVLIEIRDHGPGIPENKMNVVFEPFVRLESSRNRHTGGVGLGLAIARETARRNGGELTLRNAVDGGLIAALELPR